MSNDVLGGPPRPKIGYLVEGRGEFECYLSLMARALPNQVYMQRQLAGSCGEIFRNLESQLTSFVIRYHPESVVVSLDLREMIRTGEVDTCATLRQNLEQKAMRWLANPGNDGRLLPLPSRISIVIQIQTFEAWLIANTQGLIQLGFVRSDVAQVREADAIENPFEWLQRHKGRLTYRKSPALQKRIVSALDPAIMRTHSRSFDKLCREAETLSNL